MSNTTITAADSITPSVSFTPSEPALKITGQFILEMHDLEGNLVESRQMQNLITSAGKAAIAGLVGNTGAVTAFTYLAVGIGTTAAAIGDTALQSEITDTGLARAAATVSRQTTTVTNDTLQLTYTWTATGAKAVTELGALNAASSGVLLGRQVFSAINTSNGFGLTLTYKFQFS
ncbi:MAG: hypothetical protein WCH05_05550 [Chlorobiaceae bacterium]